MIWRIVAIGLAILLALVGPPALRHLRETPPPPPPPVRLSLLAPPGSELGAGDDVLDAAISADGRAMVFVATTDGVARLWRRRFEADRAEPLIGTEGAAMPAWKATGGVVSFFAGGRLKQTALEEGAVRDLADAPSPAGAAWLPDGSLLFVPDARGPVRRLQGGVATDATTLRAGERGHAFPAATDAGGFTYIASLAGGRRTVRLVAGGMDRDLTQTSGHAYLHGGLLVHHRDGTIVVQRFDADTGRLEVRSTPVAFDVGVSSTGKAFFAAARGVLVWAAAAARARELAWFGLDGRRLASAAEPADYWQVRLSPDDRNAAVTLLDPLLRTLDIFVLPLSPAGPREQLTLALAADTDPVWSPGGDRVLFRSVQGGEPNLFARPIHAPDAAAEAIFRSDADETPTDWRGDVVLFHAPGATGREVWALDLERGARSAATRRGFGTFDARWSPDGRRIAYVSDESGRPDIYVESYPRAGAGLPAEALEPPRGLPAEALEPPRGLPAEAAEPRRRVRASFGGGTRPEWGRNGALFFLRDGQLMRADLNGGPPRPLPGTAGVHDYTLAHHSDRFLAIVPTARAEHATAGVIFNWEP